MLGGNAGGKAHLLASFDPAAQDRGLSAVDVIREVAPIVGGGGGGRPAMARAGGSDAVAARGGRAGGAPTGSASSCRDRPDEGARASTTAAPAPGSP